MSHCVHRKRPIKKELESEKDEIQAIEDNVRQNAKDAISVSRDNLITAEFPERKDVLEGIFNSKRFPGMAWIKTMVEFYFSEIEETGRIVKRTGKFTGPDGRETTGDIYRIGRFTAYFKLLMEQSVFLNPRQMVHPWLQYREKPPLLCLTA